LGVLPSSACTEEKGGGSITIYSPWDIAFFLEVSVSWQAKGELSQA